LKKHWDIFKKKDQGIILAISAFFAIALLLINFFFMKGRVDEVIVTLVNIVSVSIFIMPAGLIQYEKYKIVLDIEEKFPDFLRNVVEGLRGGMTLPLSINYASQNYYGALDPYVRRLSAQISWGVPFDTVLSNFSDQLKSKIIARSVSTINEAHRSGGNIVDVLESVTKSTVEIEKIRKERASRISGQMMTGYIIFFVFIGVMVGLREFLIPALSWDAASQSEDSWMGTSGQDPIDAEAYGTMFIHLAVIQGVFSGLAMGKLAYGSIGAGTKHATIMSLMGYLGLVIAHAILA